MELVRGLEVPDLRLVSCDLDRCAAMDLWVFRDDVGDLGGDLGVEFEATDFCTEMAANIFLTTTTDSLIRQKVGGGSWISVC
mmetsp:Transcript_60181/g.143446  ORF Transcript_60181/g.143446 Transcript_60181/m.143446 type:complete len:82 (+) Transcript_60181:985-1230(+)